VIRRLETRYGAVFMPDTDDGQYGWLLKAGASPEDEYIDLVLAMLAERPSGVAIDGGANFGCWTLPLAQACEQVVAFEPQACVYRLLKRTLEENSVDNVVTYYCALGDHPGTIKVPQLEVDVHGNFGGLSLLEAAPSGVGSATVDLIMIDRVIPPEAHVSFLKLDIEGMEIYALGGARETIERCRPLMFVEADCRLTDRPKLQDMIEGMGYMTQQQGGNFLCVPL
jgi:FkbM family methyltransferase